MLKKSNLRKKSTSTGIIMFAKIPLLILLLLTIFAAAGHSQILFEDEYQISIGDFTGAPGDTVWMPIYFKNTPFTSYLDTVIYEPIPGELDTIEVTDSGVLGGCFIRFMYDTLLSHSGDPISHSLLTPLVDYSDIHVVIDSVGDTISADTNSLVLKFRMVGRGLKAITRDPHNLNDTSYYQIQPKPDPADDINSKFISVLWTPLYGGDESHADWSVPVIEPDPYPSVVMEIPFIVNPLAEDGEICNVQLKDGPNRENQFSSLDGLIYILPIIDDQIVHSHDGYFLVDTTGGNTPPELSLSPSGNIIINPGQSIPTITATATDAVDNDYICLTAEHDDLPNSPVFAPNDTVCGTSTAQMTFDWTSTAADQGKSYTVNFTVDDEGIGGRVSTPLTITVGSGSSTTNNAPVVAAITPGSYEIEQGEALPTINVSATDPDGDSLSLQVLGMPSGATFTGNPSLYGRGTVNATFNWLPSFTDQGLYTISFQARDSAGATNSQTIYVTVKVPDVDRLFSKSTYGTGTRPTGGIPGATPVVFPVDLISTRTVYGINFDMTYPASIADLDSVVVTDRTPEYVVYDNIGQFPDSVRVVTFGLDNEPIISGTETGTAILNAYFTLDTAAVPDDYWVNFYNARESVDPDPEIPSLALVVDSGIIQIDIVGDVNLDRSIDVADLVNVVGYIVGNYQFAKRNFETADVVRNADVNVVDLIGILNLIFGWPINPSPSPSYQTSSFATVGLEHDDLEAGQMSKLNIRGEFPEDVAGIQFRINYDPSAVKFEVPKLADAAKNFRLVYKDDWTGQINVLLYSQSPWDAQTLISSGAADIVQIPMTAYQTIKSDDESKIRISRTYLSNSGAAEIPTEGNNVLLPTTFTLHQNYPNPFNPSTKIDFDIGSANDAATRHVRLDIFNILGRRVKTLVDDNMTTGSHSVVWDATDDGGRGVATGIYLYRLEVESEHQTKKMLLLK